MKALGFNEQGGRRVVAATEGWEAMPKNRPDTGFVAVPLPNDRYAQLTDLDGSGRYSWTSLEPRESLDRTANDDWGKGDYGDGTNFAVEVKGCKHALVGDVVKLSAAKSQDYFEFNYNPGPVDGTTDGTISARSDSTAGTGYVKIDDLDTTAYTYSPSGQTVPIVNPYRSEIENGASVTIFVNRFGLWQLTGKDCVEDST